MSKVNIEEFDSILNYLLDNNISLVKAGKKPIAVGLEGPAGCGKTAIVEQIADRRGMTFVKINLAQLEEVGDLLGFPLKQFKVLHTVDGETITEWVSNDVLQTIVGTSLDYTVTSESRMTYATPDWLPRESNPNGTILFLDDYSRAQQFFMQATMELIDKGEYVSWKLPENTTIMVSSNPDDGSYSVTTLDQAQKSRYVNFPIEFDVNVWAKWAETAEIDGRAINFALSYGHEIFKENNGIQVTNARSYVTFANAISGISNWENPNSLALILNIAKGCFADEDNTIGRLFTLFLANKLDRLISPEDMLLKSWDSVKEQVRNCVYDTTGNYRPDVASILGTRLLNYSTYYFSKPGSKSDVVVNRLIEFIDASEDKSVMLFSADIIYNILRTLNNQYPSRMNRFILNSKIRDKIR